MTQSLVLRKQEAVSFFTDNAGYSYNPETETKAAGLARCANALADAELRYYAIDGLGFNWELDAIDADVFSEDKVPYQLWRCDLVNAGHMGHEYDVVASLGGIDLGRYRSLHAVTKANKNYIRVIQAELALAYFAEIDKTKRVKEATPKLLAAVEAILNAEDLLRSDYHQLEGGPERYEALVLAFGEMKGTL